MIPARYCAGEDGKVPDTKGRAYAQNPLHPEVREFYLRYIQALLEEFGKEVDGFIWDETCSVRNDNAPLAIPGYPSRAMMTLVKEVAAKVASLHSPTGVSCLRSHRRLVCV